MMWLVSNRNTYVDEEAKKIYWETPKLEFSKIFCHPIIFIPTPSNLLFGTLLGKALSVEIFVAKLLKVSLNEVQVNLPVIKLI